MTKTLTVDATNENLDRVLMFLETNLEEFECPMKLTNKLMVCAEEIYINVASYAYKDGQGKCDISMDTSDEDGKRKLSISIHDTGEEFNPLLHEDPDITLSADERGIGGLGILMVKNIMDDVLYEYNEGNTLTMVKAWEL